MPASRVTAEKPASAGSNLQRTRGLSTSSAMNPPANSATTTRIAPRSPRATIARMWRTSGYPE